MAVRSVQLRDAWPQVFAQDAAGEAEEGDDPLEATVDSPHPEPVSPRIDIHLSMDVTDVDPPVTGWLEPQLARIAALAGISDAMISVAVVDDATMTDLHQRYMALPTTTDVLSFDLRDTPDDDRVEGELVICLDEAGRQAALRQRDTRLEVLLYAVHGLLHLVGYDDQTPEESQAMHRREDELLSEAGFGPLFAD
jgi:probable rRNA maturation factor